MAMMWMKVYYGIVNNECNYSQTYRETREETLYIKNDNGILFGLADKMK